MRAVGARLAAILALFAPAVAVANEEWLAPCPDAGAGYWRLPGEDICLRASGGLRVDAGYDQPYLRSADATRFRVRGTTTLRAVSGSELGPVATTVRISFDRNTDSTYGFVPPSLDYAVVEIGGFAAGRTDSVFERAWPLGGYSFIGGDVNGRGADKGQSDLVAYTWQVAEGLTLTGSVEDPVARMTSVGNGGLAGVAMPDLVAALRLERQWGVLQLSGAAHRVRALGLAYDDAGQVQSSWSAGSLMGWGAQFSVRLQAPFLGEGGSITLQGGMARGANALTGWGYAQAGTTVPWLYDAWYDGTRLHATRSWSLGGGAQAYWTPALRSAVFGAVGRADAWGQDHDVAALTIGVNTLWSPVRDVDLGAEVAYSRLKPSALWTERQPGDSRSDITGRLRLQRDF